MATAMLETMRAGPASCTACVDVEWVFAPPGALAVERCWRKTRQFVQHHLEVPFETTMPKSTVVD
eukprot:6687234-Prorocentrum_lima.AAC.1